jgi:hypothetical protein
MRRALFLLTIALYGATVMELHEWARVPQVLVHLLEHHSDFGHHHDTPAEHGHADHDGHSPFGHDRNETCGAASLVSLAMDPQGLYLIMPAGIALTLPSELATSLSDYSGSKWNPPKGV